MLPGMLTVYDLLLTLITLALTYRVLCVSENSVTVGLALSALAATAFGAGVLSVIRPG